MSARAGVVPPASRSAQSSSRSAPPVTAASASSSDSTAASTRIFMRRISRPGGSLSSRTRLPRRTSGRAFAPSVTHRADSQRVTADGEMQPSTLSTATPTDIWGAGTQYQLTLGSTKQPVRLSPSLGADWMQQSNSGPSTTSVGLDVNVQPGGDSPLTPYAGGSVSANWVSKNAPKGALLGLEYMAGLYYKLEAQGPISLHLEVRSGYVRTQEHQVTGRFGVAFSL